MHFQDGVPAIIKLQAETLTLEDKDVLKKLRYWVQNFLIPWKLIKNITPRHCLRLCSKINLCPMFKKERTAYKNDIYTKPRIHKKIRMLISSLNKSTVWAMTSFEMLSACFFVVL